MVRFLFLIISIILLNSCASIYYPEHINTSFIEEKGETNLGAAISLSSINLHASSAIGNKLRVTAGLNYWGWDVSLGESAVGGTGLQSSFLAGYYSKLGKRSFFEGFTGIGLGNSNDDFLGRAIIQTSFGFGQEQPKFVFPFRGNYFSNSIFSNPDDGVELRPEETNKINSSFYDFAFTHRWQKANRTLFFQYGMSYDSKKYGDTDFITFLNFGINWRIFSSKHSSKI